MELLRRRGVSQVAMIVIAVAAAFFAAAIMPSSAGAEPEFGLYSHSNDGCSSRVDPIGVVFYDEGWATSAGSHVSMDAGWGGTLIEDQQHFAINGVCLSQNGANADGQVWEGRHHIRLRETPYVPDPELGYTTVGTPHTEEIVDCGNGNHHAVIENGFFDAREELLGAMWMDHEYYYSYWGNTQSFTQHCGRVVAGDGVVAYIEILDSAGHETIALGGAEEISSSSAAASTSEAPPSVVTPRGNFTLAQARGFDQFTGYSAGNSFEGHALEAVIRRKEALRRLTQPVRANYLEFIYGSCEILSGSDGGCTPPLAVQVWPACERDKDIYAFGPDETLTLRGAVAAFYEDHRRLEVYTGTVTVVIFGGGRADLLRAAAQLRGVNAEVSPGDRLPTAAPNRHSETTACQ